LIAFLSRDQMIRFSALDAMPLATEHSERSIFLERLLCLLKPLDASFETQLIAAWSQSLTLVSAMLAIVVTFSDQCLP
jgi:hypothetical protein